MGNGGNDKRQEVGKKGHGGGNCLVGYTGFQYWNFVGDSDSGVYIP